MATCATYSGWAYTSPSTAQVQRRPKAVLATLAGVSAYSRRFWPVRAESAW